MSHLAPLAIAVPLVAAALLAALEFRPRRMVSDVLAIGTGAAVTTFCAILLAHTLSGRTLVFWMGGWTPTHGVAIGISLSIDTFGAGLATLVALIVTSALVFSARYFDAIGNLFHALMLVFMAAMVGFCLTGDLFNMFVFFELMSAAAYALTAYKIEEKGPLQGAINFAITNSVGAFMVLIGIALLYSRTGALNLAQIGTAVAHRPTDMTIVLALLLITVGFLVKAAAVPLHFWLADAHAVAPVPVCVLFSGVMVELGLYAVARVYWTAFSGTIAPHAVDFRHAMIWLGVATALVGGVMCLTQRHLKRLLAFSTVSHVGIFLIGFGLLTDRGLAGSATYVIAHGLAKASLFMCVGVLLHRFASIEEHDLRGLGRRRDLALVGVTMLAGGIVIASTPMVGTFFGKSLIEESSLAVGYGWIPPVLTLASALTGGAVLRAAGRIFMGWGRSEPPDDPESEEAREEERETLRPHLRTPPIMVVPPVVLMAGAIAIGLVPGVVHAVEHAAAHFRDRAAYSAAVLHGHARFADTAPSKLTATDFGYGAASVLGAFAVAAIGLFGKGAVEALPRPVLAVPTRALAGLRDLHSGHVGDYVTWLTVALAALGGAFALTLR
jgi:multicomponent Na+:H+ antiporter subunit D